MQHYQSESYSQVNFLQSVTLFPLLSVFLFIKINASYSTSRWKTICFDFVFLYNVYFRKQLHSNNLMHVNNISESFWKEPSTVPSWMQIYFVWGFKGDKLVKEAHLKSPFWVYPSSSPRLGRGNGLPLEKWLTFAFPPSCVIFKMFVVFIFAIIATVFFSLPSLYS